MLDLNLTPFNETVDNAHATRRIGHKRPSPNRASPVTTNVSRHSGNAERSGMKYSADGRREQSEASGEGGWRLERYRGCGGW